MMAAGLLTRLAALVQIPILLGAVLVVHFQGGLLEPSQSLEFSVLVLFLLIAFFLYGSGQWSVDYYFFVRKAEEPEPEGVSARAREILERERPAEASEPEGDVLVAEKDVATVARENPFVVAEARYSALGWFLFLIDVTPRPKEIVFRHVKTGKIVDRSQDPDVIEAYRYH